MVPKEKTLVSAITRRVNASQTVYRGQNCHRSSSSSINNSTTSYSNTDFKISKKTARKLSKINVKFTRAK